MLAGRVSGGIVDYHRHSREGGSPSPGQRGCWYREMDPRLRGDDGWAVEMTVWLLG